MDRTVTAHRVLCLLAWLGLHGELAEHLSADDQPQKPVVSQVAPQTKDQSSAPTKPAAADQPDNAAIGDWIRELGAQEFATRRRAFMQLWQQGSTALPALREASTISDRQTASAVRVLELLLKLEISPTDNDELAELMQLSGGNLYRALMSLTSKGHWRLAAELLRSNQAMVAAVREKIRPDEWCQIIQSAQEQGDALQAWPVVSQLLPSPQRFYLTRLAGLDTESISPELSVDDQALIHLFRGQFDQAWALKPSVSVKHRIVFLSGRWEWLKDPELTASILGETDDSSKSRAQQAAYAYLSGDVQRSDELLARVRQEIDENTEATKESSANRLHLELLSALLICGDGRTAHKLMASENRRENLFYYTARLEYEQVLTSFGLTPDLKDFDQWAKQSVSKISQNSRPRGLVGDSEFEQHCELATFLISIGRKEEAVKLYTSLIEFARKVPMSLREEVWSDLADQVKQLQLRECLINYLDENAQEVPGDLRERLMGKLYPEWTVIADSLATLAPKKLITDGPVERRWRLLERLWRYDRTLVLEPDQAREVEDWLSAVFQESSRLNENAAIAGAEVTTIALRLGLRRQALSMAHSGKGQIQPSELAEVLMQNSSYAAASKWWDLAISQQPQQHRWLRRHVEGLRMQAESEQADAWESSIWLRPLLVDQAVERGDVSYYSLGKAWEEAGEWSLARQYAQAAFDLFDPGEYPVLYTSGQLAEILMELEDFKRCADVNRATAITLLMTNTTMPRYYNSLPMSTSQYIAGQAFLTRAVAEIEAGRIPSALDSIARFETLRPAGIEICEHCYPRLVKGGHQAEADQLLERCSRRMLDHLQTWTSDAGSHNNLAWMYARCNTRLDEALKHAELAVQQSDRAPTYVDTLAEVHFRLGNLDQAIEFAKECLVLDPRHAHYRKQLQRFRDAKVSPSPE